MGARWAERLSEASLQITCTASTSKRSFTIANNSRTYFQPQMQRPQRCSSQPRRRRREARPVTGASVNWTQAPGARSRTRHLQPRGGANATGKNYSSERYWNKRTPVNWTQAPGARSRTHHLQPQGGANATGANYASERYWRERTLLERTPVPGAPANGAQAPGARSRTHQPPDPRANAQGAQAPGARSWAHAEPRPTPDLPQLTPQPRAPLLLPYQTRRHLE